MQRLSEGRARPAPRRRQHYLPRPRDYSLRPGSIRQAGDAQPERDGRRERISQQNLQVAAGQIASSPSPRATFQLTSTPWAAHRSRAVRGHHPQGGQGMQQPQAAQGSTGPAETRRGSRNGRARPPARPARSRRSGIVRLRDVARGRARVSPVRAVVHLERQSVGGAVDLPASRLQRPRHRRRRVRQDGRAEDRFPEGSTTRSCTHNAVHQESVNESSRPCARVILVGIVVLCSCKTGGR